MIDYFNAYLKMEQQQKIDKYRILNEHVVKGQVLFTGSSLMEQFPVNELLMSEQMDIIIYNRGVGGFTTDDMLQIFINIGTNDISYSGAPFEDVLTYMTHNYEEILKQIKIRLPESSVYMMAYYPVNEVDKVPEGEWGKDLFVNRNNHNLPIANAAIQKLSEKYGCHYIDVNTGLTDEYGRLKKEFTVEGVHMYANAYRVIFENMKPYLK